MKINGMRVWSTVPPELGAPIVAGRGQGDVAAGGRRSQNRDAGTPGNSARDRAELAEVRRIEALPEEKRRKFLEMDDERWCRHLERVGLRALKRGHALPGRFAVRGNTDEHGPAFAGASSARHAHTDGHGHTRTNTDPAPPGSFAQWCVDLVQSGQAGEVEGV